MNCFKNNIGNTARNLTYQDFPYKFVWPKDSKMWMKRHKGFSLGRMYFIPLTASEQFYLRMLLTISCCPKSFADLCTFESVEYPCFQDTCHARGLNSEWVLCLREAMQIQTGSSLCLLFTSMLLFCQLSAPENLWVKFCDTICEDFFIAIPNSTIERI